MVAPPPKTPGARYTWTDYQSWPDEERWEIVAGMAYAMPPAPSTGHQAVLLHLASRIEQYLVGKPCRPFIAPTDVRLSEFDVVQPDILVVCDPTKIAPGQIEGAPDLVVEVLSPATATRDLREKKALYESSGVREYIVVDPLEHYPIRFLCGAEGGYDKGTVFAADEMLVCVTLEGIKIPLWEVFDVAGPAAAMP